MRIITLAMLVLLSTTLSANDAALNNGAHGPEPVGDVAGSESVVAMTSEELTFDISPKETSVTAKFRFRSSKKEGAARQLVGFPDPGAAAKEGLRRDPEGNQSWHNEMNVSGPITRMETFFDGRLVTTSIEYGYIEETDTGAWKKATKDTGTLMAWHAMWVEFPANRDVVIERRYHVENGAMITSNDSMAYFFEYITATGATWKGAIKQLAATVHLQGGLTTDKIKWTGKEDYDSVTRPARDQWEIIGNNSMRLVWKNFEPRTDEARRSISIVLRDQKLAD